MADLLRLVTQTVREVINEWDPYALLALGCPPDEYDTEVAAIVRALGDCKNADEAAQAICDVMAESFGPPMRPPHLEQCRPVAERLWQRLHELPRAEP